MRVLVGASKQFKNTAKSKHFPAHSPPTAVALTIQIIERFLQQRHGRTFSYATSIKLSGLVAPTLTFISKRFAMRLRDLRNGTISLTNHFRLIPRDLKYTVGSELSTLFNTLESQTG